MVAKQRKGNGQHPHDNHRRSPKVIYQGQVQRCLIQALLTGGRATSDVTDVVKRPDTVHPSNRGAAVGALVRERLIKQASVTTTRRRQGRGRLLRVWKLVDVDSAMQWLTLHVEG